MSADHADEQVTDKPSADAERAQLGTSEDPTAVGPGEAPLLGKGSALSYAVQTTGIVALVFTLLAAVLQGTFWAVGTLIGGVLATLNLMVFARVAAAFIQQKGRSAPWAVIGGIKLVGLFLCVYIILKRGDVSAVAFIMGYGALPVGISLGTLRANRAVR